MTAGINVSPSLWNCDRLPIDEEARLTYFFKLIYMERVRQLAKWGDQRHPDGTGEDWDGRADIFRRICQSAAAAGKVSWMDIILEEIYELAETRHDAYSADKPTLAAGRRGDMETEMIQSAAVLAAWFSDKCRQTWEGDVAPLINTTMTTQGLTGDQAEEALKNAIRDFRADMGDDSPMAVVTGDTLDDGGASAYGLGLPGAEPRDSRVAHVVIYDKEDSDETGR